MSLHSWIMDNYFYADQSDYEVCIRFYKFGMLFAALTGMKLVFKPAAYGRFAEAGKAWETCCPINSKFAWFIQESPSFFFPLALTLEVFDKLSMVQIVLLFAFMLHYFNRTFIYSLNMRSGRKSPLPATIMAVIFCTFNGFFQAHAIIYCNPKDSVEFSFIIGMILFFIGMVINIDSDARLRHLRSKQVATGYQIPRGGLFEYISCANYFGEIIEWYGFWIASQNMASFFFALATSTFLGTRAIHNHEFYEKKFKDYPKNRKAIIPFIY